MLDVDIKFTQGRLPIKVKFKLNTINAGLFGLSGCGKSCLLSMLAGLLKPDEGRISLDREILFDSRNNINQLANHPAIAFVSQDIQPDTDKTIRENLLAAYNQRGLAQRRFDFSTIVDLLKLEHLLDFRAQHLSSSEKQRILLGQALLAAPRLLLLDDALSSLDDTLKLQIYRFLHYAHDKHHIGILHGSSMLSEALRLTDFLVLMADGEVLAADSLQHIVSNQHLLGAAGGPAIDNILSVTVLEHDPAHGCTLAMFFGIRLVLPYTPRAIRGNSYFVGFRSQDIALSTHLLKGISIQNQVKGRVCAIIPSFDRVLVQVDAGTTFTVEITLRAFASLEMHENDTIYCLIKTHSIHFLAVDSKPHERLDHVDSTYPMKYPVPEASQ
ncbi:MAG: ATP-binding cassette domain-containing protein [Methylovulum sp.]|nr:ATP-binding cassette domain-containing protein [Methylovulum sp.]